MTDREVMEMALDAIGSAYREHFLHTSGSTGRELRDAAWAIRTYLAKADEDGRDALASKCHDTAKDAMRGEVES